MGLIHQVLFNIVGCRRSKQTLVNINYYYHQCFRSQKQELGYRQRCLLIAPCSLEGCPIPPQGTAHREITDLLAQTLSGIQPELQTKNEERSMGFPHLKKKKIHSWITMPGEVKES